MVFGEEDNKNWGAKNRNNFLKEGENKFLVRKRQGRGQI